MRCELGYYGNNCEETIEKIIPSYWIAYRIIQPVLFTLMILIIFISWMSISQNRFISEYVIARSSTPIYENIRTWILIFLLVLNLDGFLITTIDPLGYNDILPQIIVNILMGLFIPLITALMGIQVFNWIEFIKRSEKKLKRETMCQAVNSNYKPDVCVEKIIQGMGRFKLYFAVITVIEFTIQIIYDSLRTYYEIHIFGYIWSTVEFLYYFSLIIVFSIYIRKLKGIVSYESSDLLRDNSIITAINIQGAICIFVWIGSFWLFLYLDNAYMILTMFMIYCIIIIGISFVNLCIFIDFIKTIKARPPEPVPSNKLENKTLSGISIAIYN